MTLKKGLQPIQFNGPLILLGSAIMVNDTTSSAQFSVPMLKESILKRVPVKDSIVAKKALPKAVKKQQTVTKKIVKQSPKKIKTKSNNKPNNKSLNNVKKSAKAVMPKKG